MPEKRLTTSVTIRIDVDLLKQFETLAHRVGRTRSFLLGEAVKFGADKVEEIYNTLQETYVDLQKNYDEKERGTQPETAGASK